MARHVEQGMRKRTAAMALVLVAACLVCGCAVMPAGDGSSRALSWDQDWIPAGKVMTRSFDLNYRAAVTVEFEVEPGKEIDIYVLTPWQYERGKAGREPVEPGVDYVFMSRGAVGAGSFQVTVDPMRYSFVFRNRASAPVRVKTGALARVIR